MILLYLQENKEPTGIAGVYLITVSVAHDED
jgi:hypothetical protein